VAFLQPAAWWSGWANWPFDPRRGGRPWPNTKKKDKMKTKAEGSGKSLLIEPSSECKESVVALIARFYERESIMSLESCYI
jgi:hypothetical protein